MPRGSARDTTRLPICYPVPQSGGRHMTAEYVSNQQIIQAARRNLAQGAWDYLVSGSESETTMRRNRLAFDKLGLRPRVLIDVSKLDPSTTFLGHHMRIPVMLAPIGLMQHIHPEGAAVAAEAAAEFGTIQAVSTNTQPSLEETAAAGDGPKIFQLNVRGDAAWTRELLDRVKAAGYIAIAVTVDMALTSRRERTASVAWAPAFARAAEGARPNYLSMLSWDVLDEIKTMWDGSIMLKGVATAEDAALAVRHGIDVIWVSNHGGRQLDHGAGSLDNLPEIVDAVQGQAQVILDGGVQRGADVIKALALGARAVAVGKLQCWGAAAAGKDGIVRVLEILESEFVSAMGLLGVSSVDQIGPAHIRAAHPVTLPHEMSSWVNMPKGRVI
ncbi:MAG: alpha-hydroxy-acid oxidizing protein [Dehalococcoidia bacterium]|nr:alpha-hydroxy-acid oxidizing protein [Dehalococcoidia bacterium]